VSAADDAETTTARMNAAFTAVNDLLDRRAHAFQPPPERLLSPAIWLRSARSPPRRQKLEAVCTARTYGPCPRPVVRATAWGSFRNTGPAERRISPRSAES